MALSDITPIKRSEEYLQRIADAIEGSGGSDLPAVTSADNGNVLAVVDGAWSKAPAPSSLPVYTSADLGKVLTVGEAEPTVAVPEQTVTAESGDPAVVENANASYFVVGQAAVMKIDGDSYTVTAEEHEGVVGFAYLTQEDVYQFIYLPEPMAGLAAGIYFIAQTPGEYTISLEIPNDDMITKWKAPSMIYYETSGSYFNGLTVGEAANMFNAGKIPFVISSTGMKMLTNIVETSSDEYSVYYNFSNSATATNLAGNSSLPYIGAV